MKWVQVGEHPSDSQNDSDSPEMEKTKSETWAHAFLLLLLLIQALPTLRPGLGSRREGTSPFRLGRWGSPVQNDVLFTCIEVTLLTTLYYSFHFNKDSSSRDTTHYWDTVVISRLYSSCTCLVDNFVVSDSNFLKSGTVLCHFRPIECMGHIRRTSVMGWIMLLPNS